MITDVGQGVLLGQGSGISMLIESAMLGIVVEGVKEPLRREWGVPGGTRREAQAGCDAYMSPCSRYSIT